MSNLEALKLCLQSRAQTNVILSLLLLNKETRAMWENMSEEEVYGFSGQYSLDPSVFLQILKDLNSLSDSEFETLIKCLSEEARFNYTGAVCRFDLVLALRVYCKYMKVTEVVVKKRNVVFNLDVTSLKVSAWEGHSGLHTLFVLSNVQIVMTRGKATLSLNVPVPLDLPTQYARSIREWFDWLFQSFADCWTSRVKLDEELATWEDIETYLAICQFAPETLIRSSLWQRMLNLPMKKTITETESDVFFEKWRSIKSFTTYVDNGGYIIGLECLSKNLLATIMNPLFCVEKRNNEMVVVDKDSQVYQRYMLAQTLMTR